MFPSKGCACSMERVMLYEVGPWAARPNSPHQSDDWQEEATWVDHQLHCPWVDGAASLH